MIVPTRCARVAAVWSLLLLLFFPTRLWPCHVPVDYRGRGLELTAAQKALLEIADHHAEVQAIEQVQLKATPCQDGMAGSFPCRNVDLLAFVPLASMGGGTGSDLWGWTDPLTGKEYALFGRSNGTAMVDVSDPENPVFLGNLPTQSQSSAWRDIKVYADHAYIVADFAGNHGMQVFDLTQLRTVLNPPVTFTATTLYTGFQRSHNVVINPDTGFAYAAGSDTCSGGLHMIDIRKPTAPVFAGCFSADGYTHDAQCVLYHGPDQDYQGHEICFASNEDTVTIVDVTSKDAPLQVSRTGYQGRGFTHQGWLTDDHGRFVMDDETDERNNGHNTRTYVWDMSDLDQPVLVHTFTAAGSSIDHNQYVRGDHTYQANYRRGLRILHLGTTPQAMAEVAFFDTHPERDGNGFDGAWSTYPFFASDTVLVSDINRGLFVVRPQLASPPLFVDGFESGDTSRWSGP
jgi:choice-of-anchor B domain-containing protein